MKQGKTYYVHCVIGFLFMVVFWYMTPIGPVTEMGMKVLGVFLGTMYLWSFVETVWPSLFGVIMLGLTGFSTWNGVLASTFGSPLVVMLFFVILLTGAITEEGICEYIARWFITRKINNGRPWVFTTMLLMGVYILAIMTAPSPTIFIFWPILYSMFAVLGYKEGDRYATLMLIAVVMTASLGFATTPFKGALPGLLGNFTKVTGMEVEYLPYMVVGMLLVPIIHVFSQEVGISPVPVAVLSLFLVCVAIVTPAASTTSAILHGNTKWIRTKEAYGYGLILTMTALIITLLVGLPLANFMF